MGHFRFCSQLSDAVNSKDGDGETEQAHFCSRRSKNWSTRSVTALFISSRVASDAGSSLIVARSEEHTSELQSLMSLSYYVYCSKKKNVNHNIHIYCNHTIIS